MEQKADENFQSNLICSFNEVTCWNLIQNPWGYKPFFNHMVVQETNISYKWGVLVPNQDDGRRKGQ